MVLLRARRWFYFSIAMSSSVTNLKEGHLWLGGLVWAEQHFKDCGKSLLMSLMLFVKKFKKVLLSARLSMAAGGAAEDTVEVIASKRVFTVRCDKLGKTG